MSAQNFVAFVLEDLDGIGAEKDSPRDAQLREYADEGFLQLSVDGPRDRYYVITTEGFRAFRPQQ